MYRANMTTTSTATINTVVFSDRNMRSSQHRHPFLLKASQRKCIPPERVYRYHHKDYGRY